MPLVLNKNIGESTLLIWRMSESEDDLCALVTGDDRQSAFAFGSPRRRIEHLAWRAALRTLIPNGDVRYSDTGTPYVCGQTLNIGVAHTDGAAAVIVSPSPCAVDIERVERKLAKVAAKFISPLESQFADSARPDYPVVVWCAKEAMYKYSGRRELDFLRDLKITSCDLSAGKITGEIMGEIMAGITRPQTVHANIERFEEYLIVYIAS